MNWEYLRDVAELAEGAAWRLVSAAEADPKLVLGLPAGHTPAEVYRRVVAACRPQAGSVAPGIGRFAEVSTFQIDKPMGVAPRHAGGSPAFMERHLYAHLAFDRGRTHTADGWLGGRVPREGRGDDAVEEALLAECARYEQAIRHAGGLGLTLLLLGSQGQLALNEPGSPRDSRTRVVELTAATLHANAPYFAGEREPRRAITLGVGTLLESRSIVLLASGAERREAVKRLRGGFVDEGVPAAALHLHGDVTVLVDAKAAGRGPYKSFPRSRKAATLK